MPLLRRTALGLLLGLAVLAPAAPSLADPGSHPRPDPSSASALLQEQAAQQQADLTAEDARLAQAQRDAEAALEARQQAERAAGLAERAASEAAAALAAARERVRVAKGQLSGFAGALYRNGSQRMTYLQAALVTTDPGALLHDVEVAEQVGNGRARAYEEFQEAEAAQRASAVEAEAAAEKAAALRATAEQREREAATAVAAQAQLVAQQRTVLAETLDAVAIAQRREQLLARAEQIARERSTGGIPPSALAGALVPRPGASCVGGDLSGYPNGTLPESALCPLWGTAGQMLRADAAASFDAMSRAYAEQHGLPLCVTDSYRSLPEQVAVRAAKPTLAAVPGTSNHGWGVALDLCDGVERFDTLAHRWLQEHAASFGWFHPAWAQRGGSKPEPWHWEYAG